MRIIPLLLPVVLFVGLGAGSSATPLHPPPPGAAARHPGPFLLRFDENGNAAIAVNGGNPTPHAGALLPDPASDCPSCLALTYFLPGSVVTGDVRILDPDGTTSDWLRFTDSSGDIAGGDAGDGVRLIYYSLAGPGETALADVPFPDNIGSQNTFDGPTETVAGDTSAFDYRPGGVPYPAENEYIGVSDEGAPPVTVPEPASLAVLGSALVGFGMLRRRRKTA